MILLQKEKPKRPIRAVLFDFDGTISTLRSGWEQVMRAVMLEMIAGDAPVTDALRSEVDAYIDASTGIQTIFQMQWLCQSIKTYGMNKNMPEDPWYYKDIYNERLMRVVNERRAALENNTAQREQFLIAGSDTLLEALRRKGVELYVASGTDDEDVTAEVSILGLTHYFSRIAGAGYRSLQCSKERTLRDLLQKSGFDGDELLIVGDGKVEIALGREIGAWTIGAATDETRRRGVNPAKQARLKNAGAHAIIGDYLDLDTIINWMGI